MPIYEFKCIDCGRDFTVIMRISEHGQIEVKCEHCKSKNVHQKFTSFYVKTSKKS